MDTLFIGRNIIFLPEINSTNSYAIDLLKNVNLPEGSVVHTAHQTHGRGQRGSVWNAEPASNLTASVVLRPTFLHAQKQFFLYQIMALASYDTLAEILDSSQFDIKIKWPNDILVNGRKITGILIESALQNDRLSWCVAGVGINVNQQQFASGIAATSLRLLTGKTYDVSRVLEVLCRHTEKYYMALKNNKFDWVQENYLSHFFGLDTWLYFETTDGAKSLMVAGVSETGLLMLREKDGRMREADVKEIKWIY